MWAASSPGERSCGDDKPRQARQRYVCRPVLVPPHYDGVAFWPIGLSTTIEPVTMDERIRSFQA